MTVKIKLKAKPPEIDGMTWFPVAPTCGRCGGSRTTPQCWRTMLDSGQWACDQCLTPDENKWYKPKSKILEKEPLDGNPMDHGQTGQRDPAPEHDRILSASGSPSEVAP